MQSLKILAVLTSAATTRLCLDTAVIAAAADANAHIEVLHVIVDPEKLVAASEEIQLQRLRERSEGTAQERARAIEAEYQRWIDQAARPLPVAWAEPVGAAEERLIAAARDADLIVMVQDDNLDSMDTRHAAIRSTGKPLLLVPANWWPSRPRFDHVAVALSRTQVAADAVVSALPWLRAATQVTALRIGSKDDPAMDLAHRLRLMGVEATIHIVPPSDASRGAQIVDEAWAIGADLLVAGAYRHGELLEWLLGGTTRHMLAASKLPLLLAH